MSSTLIGVLVALGLGVVAYVVGKVKYAEYVTRKANLKAAKSELSSAVIKMEEKRKAYENAKRNRTGK